MIRKFNYTGRKRIARTRISITLVNNPDGPPSFDAEFDLDGVNVPSHGHIFVEAHRRAYFKRFPFGTVAHIQAPRNRYLEDLDPKALVMFRVKIVDVLHRGRILASADRIVPRRTEEEAADRICLLPVDFVDLGQSVWRLDLASDWPSLQLNRRIETVREIARSDNYFLSLVYPEVVRQILYKIVVQEDHTDPESDPNDWMSQWLSFVAEFFSRKQLPPSGESEPVLQEKLKWIDEAVEAFCSNNEMLSKFIQARIAGEQ